MGKTTEGLVRVLLGVILAFAFVPSVAIASNEGRMAANMEVNDAPVAAEDSEGDTDGADESNESDGGVVASAASDAVRQVEQLQAEAQRQAELRKQNYTIEYDRALIDTIGTQEESGHTICCPSFSCAYADAVMDGTVHDHSYYVCSNCMWTDWGGGGSAFRSLDTDELLLREAYDQISSGRPTVIHVTYGYGEHWIALIGYQNAADPDHLTLDNFIALDPWDGAQIVASERFSLYGDGCEHISDR